MANRKISELPSLTTPASGDQIAVVDVSGTPTTKKVTANNLMTLAPVQSVAGRTGTVALSNTDISGLGSAATTASTDYATAAQGATADTALQSVSAGELTDGNFDGTAILGFDATLNDQTGTAYTIVAGDAGKVITCNNGSAVTVTVPASLGAGFTCSVVQKGCGSSYIRCKFNHHQQSPIAHEDCWSAWSRYFSFHCL